MELSRHFADPRACASHCDTGTCPGPGPSPGFLAGGGPALGTCPGFLTVKGYGARPLKGIPVSL